VLLTALFVGYQLCDVGIIRILCIKVQCAPLGPVFTSFSVNICTAASRSAYCVGITAVCFAHIRRLPEHIGSRL